MEPGLEGSCASEHSMTTDTWTHPTELSLVAGPVEEDTMFVKQMRDLVKFPNTSGHQQPFLSRAQHKHLYLPSHFTKDSNTVF